MVYRHRSSRGDSVHLSLIFSYTSVPTLQPSWNGREEGSHQYALAPPPPLPPSLSLNPPSPLIFLSLKRTTKRVPYPCPFYTPQWTSSFPSPFPAMHNYPSLVTVISLSLSLTSVCLSILSLLYFHPAFSTPPSLVSS